MFSDEKILITGPGGRIAFGLARALVADNDVWGIRGSAPPASERRWRPWASRLASSTSATASSAIFRATSRTCCTSRLPSRPTTTAASGSTARAPACSSSTAAPARAALVMSSCSVYKPDPDPFHPYREVDPLGDPLTHGDVNYPASKIAEEVVARYCARSFGLPTVITRMNAAYGLRGGLPVMHMEDIVAGRPVVTRSDPCRVHTDLRRRHRIAARGVARRGERARNHRELGRRRGGHGAGLGGVQRRVARGDTDHRGAGDPGGCRRHGGRQRQAARAHGPGRGPLA